MIRLLTIRKLWPMPDYPQLPEASGVALEVDSYIPESFMVGVNFHRCDICTYASIHLLLVTITFKLFVVPRGAKFPEWPTPDG